MRPQWQTKWFETEAEKNAFVTSLVGRVWGLEVNKVNRANKTYTTGYTVRWYWRNGRNGEGA